MRKILIEHDNTILTATSFLHKILKFISLTPNSVEWYYKSLEDNPPRYYRLKEIDALASALGFYNLYQSNNYDLINNIADIIIQILDGRIVNSINYKEKNILEKIARINELGELKSEFALENFYKPIIKYRIEIDKVLNYKNVYLGITNKGQATATDILDKINNLLFDEVDILDETISIIIDPGSRKFTRKDLITNNSYPDVDIDEVDFYFF